MINNKTVIIILKTLLHLNYVLDSLQEPYLRGGVCYEECNKELAEEIERLEQKE